MKLKKIKSDMLYIRSSTQSLLQKSIDLQNIKVNQKAEQVRRFDYEIGLIAKSKQNSWDISTIRIVKGREVEIGENSYEDGSVW